jgi:hypothetical protein
MQSLYQGRPVSLQESDTRVPITFLDTYEEFEHWMPFAYDQTVQQTYPGSPAYSVSTFAGLCKLSVIMNSILNNIYAEATFDKSPDELADLREKLHSRLRDLHTQLPEHLKFDPAKPPAVIPPPHVLSLIGMYNVLLILLHRPFVSDGHLHSNARSVTVKSLVVCSNAATAIVQILRLYHEAFSVRRAPYLIAYTTYVSSTVLIRIAAKASPGSDAHRSLATCLEVFRINQETNWAARRAKTIVEGLARKLNIKLPETNEELLITRAQHPPPPPQVASHTEQRSVTAESNVEGFSPSMDIDAVIQSFAREQDQGQFGNSEFGMLNPQPVMPYQHPTPFTGVAPTDPHDTAWMDFPYDDLLFGFNNPTLDNYSVGFT